MCGFVAGYGYPQEVIHEALIKIKHRGPDNTGIYSIDKLVLGHNRLSILGLGDASNQPMVSDCKKYSLVFNGEIYNYASIREELENYGIRFETSGDTEVLFKCLINFGVEKTLKVIKGMFAFVFYSNDQFVIARDHFGIKPLYYKKTKDKILISSELSSFEFEDKSYDELYLKAYFNYNMTDCLENSLYAGVKNFQAGTYTVIDLDNIDKELDFIKYWEPKITTIKISYNDAVSKTRDLFLKSVQEHMESEVEIGAALSGGIDSASIVCAMKYINPRLKINTFSYISDDERINEEKWIDIVNAYIDATPHKVYISSDDVCLEMENAILANREPALSSSIIAQYKVFESAKKNGIKVVLDGQGADEIFAGYKYFYFTFIRDMILSFKFKIALKALKKARDNYGIKAILKEVIVSIFASFIEKRKEKKAIFKSDENLDLNIKYRHTRLKEHLKETLIKTSVPRLLRYDDRNSMNWSVESRVPFLDKDLIEFVYSLPSDYLMANGETKGLFRDAMRGIVPDSILDRKDKIGFETPQNNWLDKVTINSIPFNDKLSIKIEDLEKCNDKLKWKLFNISVLLGNDNESSTFDNETCQR